MKEYAPRPRTAEILEWTLEKIEEVPYRVPSRWAFYRCVQEKGLSKKDYKNFIKWTSKARKRFWNGWRPWTLSDDTRNIIELGKGLDTFEEWMKSLEEEEPTYEKFSKQENLVMIWFEARAMYPQFMHYAAPYNIPLAPFGGDPGPDFKWRIAEFLSELSLKYPGKPIIILYFGDYEPLRKTGSRGKGIRIPKDALKDIKPWFQALWLQENKGSKTVPAINFIRCGLNPEHIKRWGIPENFERPDEYQWEALSDEYARELIVGSIEKHWRHGAIKEVERREEKDAKRWKRAFGKVRGAIK